MQDIDDAKNKRVIFFSQEIERFVHEANCDYMEAIIHYSEKHSVDVETLAVLIQNNENLKGKLQLECMKKNLVEKIATLPF